MHDPECSCCNGEGKHIFYTNCNLTVESRCDDCDGKGTLREEIITCPDCNGEGVEHNYETRLQTTLDKKTIKVSVCQNCHKEKNESLAD